MVSSVTELIDQAADATGLTEVGRIATGTSDGMANRSLVIGDQVYLLSDQSLQSHGLDNLRLVGRVKL